MARIKPHRQGRVFSPEQYAQLDAYIDDFQIDPYDQRRKDILVQVLHHAQDIFGCLPEEVQLHIASRFTISHAEVSGVISFYNFFTTTAKGKVRINVCLGTACYVNGADKVLQEFERILGIKAGQVTEDGKFSIDSLRCVGACGLAPVVTLNEKVDGKVQVEKIKELLENYLIETGEEVAIHA